MSQVFFIFVLVAINIFPYVRQFLPQREEDWLFELTSKHKNIVKRIHEILKAHHGYYNNLSEEGKERFVRRIVYIIFKKTLIGYHDLKVTTDMAILIMAAQVQLTFGLKRFSLPHFKRIIVYPEQFYSNYFKQNVKGLTSGRGFITLSWKDSLEGIADPNDNINLLLHEYAHALMIHIKNGKDNDRAFVRSFEDEGEMAMQIFAQLKERGNSKHHYLRDYGFTNKNEFFAVCVEHFFETPKEFKEELNVLYRLFCQILNQDPLNDTNDYQLNEKSV